MSTITITEQDLARIVSEAAAKAVAEALAQNTAPARDAKPSKAKATRKSSRKQAPAKDESFVTWIRDTAEERQARKQANADLSAWLKAKGLPIGGEVWTLAKAGERRVRTLQAAAKRDAKARAAAKA